MGMRGEPVPRKDTWTPNVVFKDFRLTNGDFDDLHLIEDVDLTI